MGDAFRHNLSDLLTSTLSSLLRIIASHTCPLLLLERHTDLTRAFAGASIRTSALTAAGKTLAVTHTTISAKVDQSLDRELNFATEVAFNRKLADLIADLFKISVSEILDLLGKFNAAIRKNFTSARTADAINGSETDFGMLLRRNINTGDTSHLFTSLALTLLVTRVRADHAHHAFALNDLALAAHLFDRSVNLHSHLHVQNARITMPTWQESAEEYYRFLFNASRNGA